MGMYLFTGIRFHVESNDIKYRLLPVCITCMYAWNWNLVAKYGTENIIQH